MNIIKKTIITTIFIAGILSYSNTQTLKGHCGMTHENFLQMNEKALEMRSFIESGNFESHKSQGEVTYIPVKFHLVAETDGDGRIYEHHVLNQLCLLNEAYMDYEIQFYIKDGEFNYIDNDAIYNNPNANGSELRMGSVRDDEAMDLFITRLADTPGGIGTTLGYYSRNKDWIVLRSDQFDDGYNSTIGHEVGHFFSLLHPHNGWDNENYNESTHGNPVQRVSPGNVPTEWVNRANCTQAGDYLCDTPEDYNFGFGWSNCNYTRNIMDPNGDQVDPMEINFMGYFLNCPDKSYIMTPEQVEQMQANIASSDRDYLRLGFIPDNEDNGLAYLLNPTRNEQLDNNQNVEFDWTDVSNANRYLLQIATGNAFLDNSIVHSEIYDESYAVVDEIPANVALHYRVIAYNEYSACFSRSELESKNFRTGLGTDINENELSHSKLVKTVIGPAEALQFILATDDKDLKFDIYNSNGKQIRNTVEVQNDFAEINHSIETPGLYFLKLSAGSNSRTFKFVVQ